MKQMIFLVLCALAAAGAAAAQTGPAGPEPVTISGNLGITGGMISLESGGSLYYVTGLNRFIGFIDGLKEGAAVSLTGYAFDSARRPGAKVFRAAELRLNGKSYDLAPPPAEFRRPEAGPRPPERFPQGGHFRPFGDRWEDRREDRGCRGWGGPDRRSPRRRD